MKKFIVILALVLNYSTQAQITITSADMPQEGMNYIYSNASTFGSFDLSVGEDVDWNYLSLDGISQDSMSYVSVDEAPFAYQFLFNNFFFPEYLADYALHIPD